MINCLNDYQCQNFYLPHMFIYSEKEFHSIFLDYWHWYYYLITLVQSFKSSSNMNLSNVLNVNDHIKLKIPTPKNKYHTNYSAMEPVLFEKLHNIKLSHSVFRVTTFLQFDSTKAALRILLQYAHDLNGNLETCIFRLSHK